MTIRNLTPGGYASNCYLVNEGSTAVLIDCTAPAADIVAALEEEGAHLAAILLTHGHFDHMLTLEAVKVATGAPIYLAARDSDLPGDGEKNAFAVFFGYDRRYPEADILFDDGDLLTFGTLTLRAIYTPGHTRGSAVFLIEDIAFTGDTLFADGCGRYDLYGGDRRALVCSLGKLAVEPLTTVIYPGHGEPSTLGAALDTLQLW